MNINDLYTDITSFWNSIYPLTIFHLVFFFSIRFIYRRVSIKHVLKNYIHGERFKLGQPVMTYSPGFWISEVIQESSVLEFLLDKRKLRLRQERFEPVHELLPVSYMDSVTQLSDTSQLHTDSVPY